MAIGNPTCLSVPLSCVSSRWHEIICPGSLPGLRDQHPERMLECLSEGRAVYLLMIWIREWV